MTAALKTLVPSRLRRALRAAWETRQALAVLKKARYDAARVQAWSRTLKAQAHEALLLARDCALLETQPYFRPGIFQALWKGLGRDEALIAAADNCLHGLRLERELLKDWQRVSEDKLEAERAMVRVLNESVIHAVRFCGGWARAYAGGGYPDNPAVARMAGLLKSCPGRALDIGAGGLPFYPVLKQRPEWVASDLNLPALRIMQAALDLPPGRLVCHDAQVLPFPDGSFHTVLSRYVIENVLRPRQMLSEVFRALTAGGSFIVLVPKAMFTRQGQRYFTNRGPFPSKEEFERWCLEIGFVIDRYYQPESVYHLRKPGVMEPSRCARGFKDPDGSAHEGLIIDGIPVLLPRKFIFAGFGRLAAYADQTD